MDTLTQVSQLRDLNAAHSSEARDKYIEFIKACYRYYPDAFAYYAQLIDHLGFVGSQSNRQTIEHFEITASPTPLSFPKNFPFKTIGWNDDQHLPRVAVLHGFPSPHCIAFLGARFGIRPEFFLTNLNRRGAPHDGYYELPTLPSLQENLVRIHLVSPFKSLVDNLKISLISHRRSDIERACSKHERGLVDQRRYGETRYRRVNLHDSQICSLEQAVSLTIAQKGDHWYAIFLTDHGRAFTVPEGFPWSKQGSNGRPIGTIALVPYNSPVEYDAEISSTDHTIPDSPKNLDQFHPLKGISLTDQVDFELLKSDPFFLFASLLRTSLQSWAQLLNILTDVMKSSQSTLELSTKELRYDLDQLRYHIGFVNRAKEQVSELIELAKRGGCISWPKASSDEQRKRKRTIQRQLECDCINLIDRCSFMLASYESATAVLVGFAQLKASEKQMSEAKEVSSLTMLATIFIPLSFSASIYGMNISQWQPSLSVWWFLGTCLVSLLFTGVYLYKQWWIQETRDLWHYVQAHLRTRN